MGQGVSLKQRSIWWTIIPNGILIVLAIIASAYLWLWSATPENLPITNVRISNCYHKVSKEELQSCIQPFLSYGFMTLPIQDLRAALLDLTWVDKVSVRRIWPDTLDIKVQEQVASARWGDGGVLNLDGVLFHPLPKSIPENLPQIIGPSEMSQSIFQHYQALQARLNPCHLKIVSVQVSARHSWQLLLDNQMVVVLGAKNHRQRLERFVKVLPKLSKTMSGKIHQVDLRYPNGLAVS